MSYKVQCSTKVKTINANLSRGLPFPQNEELKINCKHEARFDVIFNDFLLHVRNGDEPTIK